MTFSTWLMQSLQKIIPVTWYTIWREEMIQFSLLSIASKKGHSTVFNSFHFFDLNLRPIEELSEAQKHQTCYIKVVICLLINSIREACNFRYVDVFDIYSNIYLCIKLNPFNSIHSQINYVFINFLMKFE